MTYTRKIVSIAIVSLLLCFTKASFAQCDTIANVCVKHLTKEFISDGQTYRVLLINDQTAEFHNTFYGGTTYRVAACTGFKDSDLIFTVKDSQGNILFTNKDHSNSPYWNFKINSTIDCIIEATLNPETKTSGCAVLLIGFKQ